MDPMIFATLVGLICDYSQEKGARETRDRQKFIEWLDYHRHEDLKNLIVNTAALQTEVDNLLRADHAQILQQLNSIGEMLARLMSRMDGFRGIAVAAVPSVELSNQAVSILRQFAETGEDRLFYNDYGGGQWSLQTTGHMLEVTEPRFIEDDIQKLLDLNLLSGEPGSNGGYILRLTRNGVRYLSMVKPS